MRSLAFLVLTAILMTFGITAVGAAPPFPPGAEAREARLVAKMKPKTRAWLRQEATRARMSNTISEAAAAQAVRSAGPGLDLTGLSVEDAVLVMMMMISRDTRDDMNQMLSEMDKSRSKKKAEREATQKTSTGKAVVSNQLPQKTLPRQGRPIVPRSQALDGFLASQRVSYDSLGDLSQEQQLRMKKVLDRHAKAESAISSAMKKSSDTEAGIIRNIR